MSPRCAAPRRAAPTARQLEVLGLIEKGRKQHGYAPSLRELGAALGIVSLNGTNDFLKALVRKGLLERTANIARSYRATPAGLRWLSRAESHPGHALPRSESGPANRARHLAEGAESCPAADEVAS